MPEAIDEAEVKQAAKIVKKMMGDDTKAVEIYNEIADDLNISTQRAIQIMYYAEPVAFPELEFAATSKSVKNARDVEKLRWERISARTGESVAAVQKLYEDAGGDVQGSHLRRSGNGKTEAADKKGKASAAKSSKAASAKGKANKAEAEAATETEDKSSKGKTRTRKRANLAASRP